MVREVKVNGASGGPGSGKEGACRPAGCWLGGEARLAVPLAWPRRQPDFCRERNRRWSCLASRWCCCRRLHSRQKPGRASPARRGEQPTSAGTCALRSTTPRLMHQRVMLRAQQRQILHHSRPAIPVRVLVMCMQRPRRRPRTPGIRAMPIPKRECDPLSPDRKSVV